MKLIVIAALALAVILLPGIFAEARAYGESARLLAEEEDKKGGTE